MLVIVVRLELEVVAIVVAVTVVAVVSTVDVVVMAVVAVAVVSLVVVFVVVVVAAACARCGRKCCDAGSGRADTCAAGCLSAMFSSRTADTYYTRGYTSAGLGAADVGSVADFCRASD